MGIWLSCGHREDDFDKQYQVITKGEDCDEDGWHKALFYKTVCASCKEEYKREGILFEDEKEATEWLCRKEEE